MSSLMTGTTTICWLFAIVFFKQTTATPTKTDPQDLDIGGTDSSTKCVHSNQEYEQGQIFWPDHCQTCVCGASGELSCITETCEPLVCPLYHHKETLPGECCSSCARSTCYWKGRWYEGGDTWIGSSLDNGQYCKVACRCEADSNVTCNKSHCGSIPPTTNGNSRESKKKGCRDDGKRYQIGQSWTKQMSFRSRRMCTINCTCKKNGKTVCKKNSCKTTKPTAKYQLGPRGNRAPCSDISMGERQHRDRFLYYVPNNSGCVKECLCLSGNFYCNKSSCTQAAEQMPTCGMMKAKAKHIKANGCISMRKQPATQCPQYCARTQSMRLVKCCQPVHATISIRFKCPDGRRPRLDIPQVASCKCNANCNSGEEVSTTSGDVPAPKSLAITPDSVYY